jgi:hypothetical protein
VNLDRVVWGVVLDGWQLHDPTASFGVFVNDNGTVFTGTGINQREAWVAVVLEPSCAALAVVSSAALLWRRRH